MDVADNVTIAYITFTAEAEVGDSLLRFGNAYARVHGYLATVVCVFGICANLANVIVLTRKNMISSTNCILTWLAVADLLTMVSYFFFVIHFYLMKAPATPPLHTNDYGWVILLQIHASFSIVCHTIATWLTIVLAIFRYIYIWLPTRGAFLCSITRAKVSILIVYVAAVVLLIPNYLANVIQNVNYNKTDKQPAVYRWNETFNYTLYVDVSKQPLYHLWFDADQKLLNTLNYWIQAVMLKLVPCIMLTLLTILLILAMHVAYNRRMRLKNQNNRRVDNSNTEHNRTTLMLLAIVILFLITELPQGILTLLSIFIRGFFDNVYMPLGDILDMVALVNNSVNFVLYCSMSKQFRDTFSGIFCRCLFRKRRTLTHMPLITTDNGHKSATTAVTERDANSVL